MEPTLEAKEEAKNNPGGWVYAIDARYGTASGTLSCSLSQTG
jgi:hypothetical protein